jgi:1-acyl-sn-glycerol-3-phosphate acyltransferase
MDAAERLLLLITRLRDEMRPGQTAPVRLTSRLDQDLGFDSLARSELLLRVEAEFAQHLPQRLLVEAETARDFLAALAAADPQAVAAAPAEVVAMPAVAGAACASVPAEIDTLAAVLQWHATRQPQRKHLSYIHEDETTQSLSYGDLWLQARGVAAALQARDIHVGDAVALMLPTCPEFFPCFCGILLAGAVPVPIYPPARPSQLEDHLRRHAAILANARARLLIASDAVALPAELLGSQVESLTGVARAAELLACTRQPEAVPVHSTDLALLQYTSGSTGTPKGVMLTHGQLLANIHAMAQAAGVNVVRPDDVFVSWLPLYHDMGLICAWLSSLVYAVPFVVMSPLTFLARPERWLRAIHRHRGTLSGAPNFAYELCLKRIDAASLAGLDLSSWRLAFNGAEPVSPATMERFADRFGNYGLRREALAPVYGLAECAVGLALTPGRGVRVDTIRRAAFVTGGQAIAVAPAEEGACDVMRFVACGQPLPGYEIRIVDPVGGELPERAEGRLQFRGPSATAGYFRNPQATEELVGKDGWLDSGDYAYLAGGEVYLTGRAKDIIIKGGRNIYPQEVEEAVGNLPGVRKGCVAVFGSPDPASGTERLVVAAETRESDGDALQGLRHAIQETVVSLLGQPADDVVLSAEHIVLKTSSGKVRRAASRVLYESGGKAGTAPRAVWLQVARLLLAASLPQLRRGARALTGWLYGVWSAAMFLICAVPAWMLVAMSPQPRLAWSVCRVAARFWLFACGIRLRVNGAEHLPATGSCVVAVNHASYLDGIVFVAALPWSGWRFVAKRELSGQFIPRIFLQRLGCEFVERFDFQQGVADADHLADHVANGGALVFFPEGTFTRVPGLRPFRMGAFFVAAQNGVPVLPVALSGTRDVLRETQWLPRRGTITVTVAHPIRPLGRDWAAAVGLRDAVRAEILKDCGEGDLQG